MKENFPSLIVQFNFSLWFYVRKTPTSVTKFLSITFLYGTFVFNILSTTPKHLQSILSYILSIRSWKLPLFSQFLCLEIYIYMDCSPDVWCTLFLSWLPSSSVWVLVSTSKIVHGESLTFLFTCLLHIPISPKLVIWSVRLN